MSSLIQVTDRGLYCPPADIFIDPWRPVPRAIITHAHSDHARAGHESYLAHHHSLPILRARLGREITIEAAEYGERKTINGVRFSLHPAGHVLGSAQIRIEHNGEVWVISGDYKLEPDRVAANFESVPCHVFVTESTFGLPVYRWPDPAQVMQDIDDWWAANQAEGVTSFLLAYSLGKAQRLLAGLKNIRGPIYVHGAVNNMNMAHLEAGVRLPECGLPPRPLPQGPQNKAALVVAPPSVQGAVWARKFAPISYAYVSGWMAVRGAKRRRSVDRGFILSDHADWDGLNQAVRQSGAEKVFVTHGYSAVYARWLREHMGIEAEELETLFSGDEADELEATDPASAETDITEPKDLKQTSDSGTEDTEAKAAEQLNKITHEDQSAAGQTGSSKASLEAQAEGAAIKVLKISRSGERVKSKSSNTNAGNET